MSTNAGLLKNRNKKPITWIILYLKQKRCYIEQKWYDLEQK